MKTVLLISLCIINLYSQTGSIRGKAYRLGYGLYRAVIQIEKTDLHASTDEFGNYEIKNVPFGSHVLLFNYGGVVPNERDTIKISSEHPDIVHDFPFAEFWGIVPDSIKQYRQLFKGYKSDEMIKIHVDSIHIEGNPVLDHFIYVTFTNITKYPLYIFDDDPCCHTVKLLIRSDSGESVYQGIVNMGCDLGGPYLPKQLLELKPSESVQLKSTFWDQFDFNRATKGKYTVAVKYFWGEGYEGSIGMKIPRLYGNPHRHNNNEQNKSYIDQVFLAVQGTFYSENRITVVKE